MKKIALFLFAVLFQNILYSQINTVLLKVDGLTCSACSFATQKSILQLDFVEDIKMDLNSHIATITFKTSKKISIQQISKKVYDAGFSVGSMVAVFEFKSNEVSENTCFEFEGDLYHFEQMPEKTVLNGIVSIKFIGDKYMSKSEFKKWKKNIKKEACKKTDNFSGQIYSVILLK